MGTTIVTQLVVDASGAKQGVAEFEAAMGKAKGLSVEYSGATASSFDKAQRDWVNSLRKTNPVLDAQVRAQAAVAEQQRKNDEAVRLGIATQAAAAAQLERVRQQQDKNILSAKEHAGQLSFTERAMLAVGKATSGVSGNLIAMAAGLGPIGVGFAGIGGGVTVVVGLLGFLASSFQRTIEMADAFASKAQNTRRVLDQAEISGVVFKALGDQAKRFGIDTDELANFLQQLNARFYELRLGGGDFLKRVREIDSGIADQMMQSRDLVDVLSLLQQAMNKSEDVYQRTSLFRAAGGRGGPREMALFKDFDISAAVEARRAELEGYEQLLRRVAFLQDQIKLYEEKAQSKLAKLVTEEVKTRELSGAKLFNDAAAELEKNGDTWTLLGMQFQLLLKGEFSKAWDIHSAAVRRTTADLRDYFSTLATGAQGAANPAAMPWWATQTPQARGGIGGGLMDTVRASAPAGAKPVVPLTPQGELANLRAIAAALGDAAGPTVQLEIKQKALSIALKEVGIGVNDQRAKLAQWILVAQDSIDKESRRLGALGASATVEEQVAQRRAQLVVQQAKDRNITDAEIRQQVELTRVRISGIEQMRAQADASRVEIATQGMSIGAAAAYRVEWEKINEARRNGQIVSQETQAGWHKEAQAAGEAAQASAQFAAKRNADFELQTVFLTDIDRQIAQIQRSLHGDMWSGFMNDGLAASMRIVDALKQVRDVAVDIVSGGFKDFRNELMNGAKAFDALRVAAANALNKISDKLIDMASKKLVDAAFGGMGGGGGILALLTGTTGGPGTVSGSDWVAAGQGIGPLAAAHSGGIVGQIPPTRYIHAPYFDDLPRFGTGGIVGRERLIIAHDDEEVLTTNNPRHRFNAGAGGGVSVTMGGTSIVVQGNADKETLALITRELDKRDRELSGKVVTALKEARRRSVGV